MVYMILTATKESQLEVKIFLISRLALCQLYQDQVNIFIEFAFQKIHTLLSLQVPLLSLNQ